MASLLQPLSTALASAILLTAPLRAAAPVLDDPIPAVGEPARVSPSFPVGKTLLFPITASDADGDALSYKVTSSNPLIMARVKTGNPLLKMTVNHTDGGASNPAYSGELVFMLMRDWMPVSSGFIGGMAQSGFYDNVLLHRITSLGDAATGFIFQGGDPLGTGGGGPGMVGGDQATSWKFQNEFKAGLLFTGRGQLAMANAGTQTSFFQGPGGSFQSADYRDTNGSQFFITDGQPRHLDFNHNIFGQLLRGWDLLPKLKATTLTASSSFVAADFLDLPGFVTKLKTQADPVSAFLWQTFSAASQAVLNDTNATPTQQQTTLIAELGEVLSGVSIYDATRFAAVTLSPQTLALKAQSPTGEARKRLNRLLLQDAYPVELRTIATVSMTATSVVPSATDAVLVLSSKGIGSSVITVSVNDGNGGVAVKTFTVNAVSDSFNSPPFLEKIDPVIAAKTDFAIFNLRAVDLEFDYLDIPTHKLLGTDATHATLRATSGGTAVAAPNTGYTGKLDMGFDLRQFNIADGGFDPTADSTNARIGIGDRAARGEGATIEAEPGVALTNVIAGRVHDLDLAGSPADFTAKINWGDGTPLDNAALGRDASQPGSSSYYAIGTHTYARAGVYPVVVEFTGNLGALATARGEAHVSAAAIRATGQKLEIAGSKIVNRVLATFTDAASTGRAIDYEATVDWGDGLLYRATVVRQTTGVFTVRGTHAYRDSEPYSIRVRVHKKGDLATNDAFTWSTAEMRFNTAPHLPPFPHPKLTIAWNSGPNKFHGGAPGPAYQVQLQGDFIVLNTGNRAIGQSKLRFWLSTDAVLTTTGAGRDTPVKVNGLPELAIIPFAAGGSGSGTFTLDFPLGESGGRKFLLSEAVYSDPIANHDGTDKVIVTGPIDPAIVVTPLSGLTTTEAGGTATFTVTLDTAPTADVTIPLESSVTAEGTVSPAQLTFTALTWQIPQTVTITGVDDALDDGSKPYKIRLKAALSTDSLYTGVLGPEVSATNIDNDPTP